MQNNNQISLNEIDIRDSNIEAIKIYQKDYLVCIDIIFVLSSSKKLKHLKLRCIDVIQYDFYWDSKYSFYDVSHYKLMIDNNLYYLSLDPYDEEEIIFEEDNDFLICKQMAVFLSDYSDFSEYKEFVVVL